MYISKDTLYYIVVLLHLNTSVFLKLVLSFNASLCVLYSMIVSAGRFSTLFIVSLFDVTVKKRNEDSRLEHGCVGVLPYGIREGFRLKAPSSTDGNKESIALPYLQVDPPFMRRLIP